MAISGALCVASLIMAIDAIAEGGFATWIVAPVALLLVACFGWIFWWSAKRRVNDEPALIIDEVGVFDNVSIVNAGRVKWREMERAWLAGPRWMQFLCVLPDAAPAYIARQDDSRGLAMRVNKALFGAPVAIPMGALDMSQESIWERVCDLAGATAPQPPTSNFVTGA